MAKPSEPIAWKRMTYPVEKVCWDCGKPVTLNGVAGSFNPKTKTGKVRHIFCGPKVYTFRSCGCEACELVVAAIEDAQAKHGWAP